MCIRDSNSTAGMDLLTKMPRFLLRFVVWMLHKLDFYGRVPEALIKTDPNHATCFITNLGSIGLRSGYHHLSNWGTNSIFVVIGEKKLRPVYDDEGNMRMKETMDCLLYTSSKSRRRCICFCIYDRGCYLE